MPITTRPSHIAVGVVALATAAAVAVGGAEALNGSSTTAASSSSSATWDRNGNGSYDQGYRNGYREGYGKGYSAGSQSGSNGDGSQGSDGSGGLGGSGGIDGNGSGIDPFGDLGGGSGSSGSGSDVQQAGEATAKQVVGVVNITTTLDYGTGEAAGTGMVLTSDGRILTNNHVVDGATSIKVEVISTGRTYTAKVVGTSPTNDVAVLQLENASGLQTVTTSDSSSVSVGDAVTGVGNAGNEAGTSAAEGKVTATDQEITASDAASSSDSEKLTGLIETNADIQSGDSGGPLYDSDGKVIGIDTAAQTDQAGNTTAGYAIPINHALQIAQQIVSGVDNDTIHQGLPAFLGIQMSTRNGSPTVAGTVSGSAAAKAGITQGSTITAIGRTKVSTSTQISAAIQKYSPGDSVRITWTDAGGTSHSTTVTLGEGPAD